MREDRHFNAKERRQRLGAKESLKPRVVGMGHQRHAAGQHLGAGRLDLNAALALRTLEGDPVVIARSLTVFQFGLGDGGAKVNVPERGRDARVDLAAL